MIRTGNARWTGDLKSGSGTVSTQTGVLKDQKYSFNSRVEDAPGTNPEELVGAAHAACFSMAFANELSQAGFVPDEVKTTAKVHLAKTEGGLQIPRIELVCAVKVTGADDAKVQEIGQKAKAGCPVSRLYKGADITLELTRG